MSTVFSDLPSEVPLALPPANWTVADVVARLPGIPLGRIRTFPSPGTATEHDCLEAESRTRKICELIEGTLVEKVTASHESQLAGALIYFLYVYLETNNIGAVFAPDGLLKIMRNQIRAPDVSFIRWERFPGGRLPDAAIFEASPNLAVEILSPSNTKAEMNRKLEDYFESGTQLVWLIEPKDRTARAYTGVKNWNDVASDGSLVGGEVLPSFELPLAKLFARVEGPGLAS